MAGQQIDARGWVFEISDGAATPTWTEIDGINEWSLDPAANEESSDDTTFASGGAYESVAMQRGPTLELTGRMKLDTTTGDPDPGQKLVEDAAARVSDASLVDFRFRHVSQTEWKVWRCWFSLGEQGGGNNARTSWAATATRSGASTTEAVV